MCLSTVYNKSVSNENILLRNVQRVAIDGDAVILTDLMENDIRVIGKLILADLTGGKVIMDAAEKPVIPVSSGG